jgi:hypothetical protein
MSAVRYRFITFILSPTIRDALSAAVELQYVVIIAKKIHALLTSATRCKK